MESWEVLEIVIPRKASEKVALLLGVTADYVRRWRREPESEDSPKASGQRSILDRICDLIDVCFLVNPKDVYLVIRHINNHYNNLVQTHSVAFETQHCQAKTAAELLQEAVEAVNQLNLEACDDQTYIELVQLRAKTDSAIAQVEKTLRIKD
ncbi:MAG: hypothetical protein K1X72_04385 [Pyrinomonadaceae bacterium]|nr:hypothetical protein [Pyrinomonadaceae bacterium]